MVLTVNSVASIGRKGSLGAQWLSGRELEGLLVPVSPEAVLFVLEQDTYSLLREKVSR